MERPEGDHGVATDTVRNVRGRRKRTTVAAKPVVNNSIPTVTIAVRTEINTGECPRLSSDGKCNGLYYGFLCIKDKCKMQNREASCQFCIGGDYCIKYNRFGCVGQENCGTKDDYLSFIRKARENVEAYQ
jgi:hypothetical protein